VANVGNYPATSREAMKLEFLEHLLRSSTKSQEPTPTSMFFPEPEFGELDVFGTRI
jgi:hypothetical protein